MFSTNWGWDTDQRKVICNAEKEPSVMAGGSSWEDRSVEAPGTDGEAKPPPRAEGPTAGTDYSRWLTVTSCVRLHPSEQLCSRQAQANVEALHRWCPPWNSMRDKNTGQLHLVLYGKSRRKGYKLFPALILFYFSRSQYMGVERKRNWALKEAYSLCLCSLFAL